MERVDINKLRIVPELPIEKAIELVKNRIPENHSMIVMWEPIQPVTDNGIERTPNDFAEDMQQRMLEGVATVVKLPKNTDDLKISCEPGDTIQLMEGHLPTANFDIYIENEKLIPHKEVSYLKKHPETLEYQYNFSYVRIVSIAGTEKK